MGLARSTIFNSVSHAYMALAGLLATIVYINLVDPETYGLIALYGTAYTWLILLDCGLGATIVRETARQLGCKTGLLVFQDFLQQSKKFFYFMACGSALIIILSAEFIATQWLNIEFLNIQEAIYAIRMMAISLLLRFASVVYKSILIGLEDFTWLSLANSFFATLRFVTAIPFFIYCSKDIVYFFIYQIVISTLELATFRMQSRTRLNNSFQAISKEDQIFSKPVDKKRKNLIKFSTAAGISAILWIAITQVDRIFFSKTLSLTDFGHFNMAVVLASAVFAITSPINTVLTPRMAKLNTEQKWTELFWLYHTGTQIIATTILPIAATICIMAPSILWSLTGNQVLVDTVAPILSIYVTGNTLLIFSLFPYLLQFAHGNMNIHLLGVLVMLLTLLIAMLFLLAPLTTIKMAWLWLGINALYFMAWPAIIHRRYSAGLHFTWLSKSIAPIAAPVLVICLAWNYFMPTPTGRIEAAVFSMLLGACLLTATICASSVVRNLIRRGFCNYWFKK